MRLLLAAAALLALAPVAAAQAPYIDSSQPALLDAAETAPNLYLGLAGIAGALAAVFISGGLLYSSFGGVGLEEDLVVVKQLRDDYKEMKSDASIPHEKLKIASETWNAARDDANRKAAVVYVGGFLVYTAAGGLIAAFFADGLIDAFIIGLGWTGMVSSLASRYNVSIVQEKKNAMNDALLKQVESLNQQLATVRVAVTSPPTGAAPLPLDVEPLRQEQLKKLRDEVQQVRKMGW